MALPEMFTGPSVVSSALGVLGSALGGGTAPSYSTSGGISSTYNSPFVIGDGNQLEGGGQGDDAADLIGRTVSSVVPILVFGVLIWAVLRIFRK